METITNITRENEELNGRLSASNARLIFENAEAVEKIDALQKRVDALRKENDALRTEKERGPDIENFDVKRVCEEIDECHATLEKLHERKVSTRHVGNDFCFVSTVFIYYSSRDTWNTKQWTKMKNFAPYVCTSR